MRHNVVALIIRIGFWGVSIIILRNPQNSIGKYLGPLYYCVEKGTLAKSSCDSSSFYVWISVLRDALEEALESGGTN